MCCFYLLGSINNSFLLYIYYRCNTHDKENNYLIIFHFCCRLRVIHTLCYCRVYLLPLICACFLGVYLRRRYVKKLFSIYLQIIFIFFTHHTTFLILDLYFVLYELFNVIFLYVYINFIFRIIVALLTEYNHFFKINSSKFNRIYKFFLCI